MRRISVFACLVVALLILSSRASEAQTPCTASPCLVGVSKPFTALADHEPNTVEADTTGYRLYINGTAVQTKLVAALTNIVNGVGTISFAVAGLPKGTHVIYIEAYGDGGATASTTLTLSVVPGRPRAPLNLRIVTQ
jgi:hypothetical protein